MTIVLLVTCVLTPLNIAFQSENTSLTENLVEWFIDLCFFFDIIVIFNSAYYDEDYIIVD
jgi:hypothetical protein